MSRLIEVFGLVLLLVGMWGLWGYWTSRPRPDDVDRLLRRRYGDRR